MLPRNDPTAMELAFARLPASVVGTPLGGMVLASLERNFQRRGKHTRKEPGWSSNLSYRTFRGLVAKGAMEDPNERGARQ